MWLVSCRRQGILAQPSTPDPKCKLDISSLLTLPHLLDLSHLYQECYEHCIFIMNDGVGVCVCVWGGGGGGGGGWLIHIRVWMGGHGVGVIS